MTREEIEKRIADLEGMTQTEPDGTKWDMVKREDLVLLIQSLLPNLPDNLDEANNDYVLNIRKGYPQLMDETDRYIKNAFKAGAEWMAGQGVGFKPFAMTALGEYIKALIECYATQPGRPYTLPDESALKIEKKVLELAKKELNQD